MRHHTKFGHHGDLVPGICATLYYCLLHAALLPFSYHSVIKPHKVYPKTGHKGPEGEQMHSPPLLLTFVLDAVEGQGHNPATLPWEEPR
jgi:hypothetical protein